MLIFVMFIVYMLRMENGSLYTGQTKDLEKRLETHRKGKGAKYVRAFGEFVLVYKEACIDRSAAMKREAEIKKMGKLKKELLVKDSVIS